MNHMIQELVTETKQITWKRIST